VLDEFECRARRALRWKFVVARCASWSFSESCLELFGTRSTQRFDSSPGSGASATRQVFFVAARDRVVALRGHPRRRHVRAGIQRRRVPSHTQSLP